MKGIRYAFILSALLVLNTQAENPGSGVRHVQKSAVMQDGRVARYYSFGDVKDSKSAVKDLKGSGADLVFMPYREGDRTVDDLKVVEGRVEGRNAVRLDRGWYQGPPVDIKEKQFAFCCWFRRTGAGSIMSSSGVEEGHIVSVSGWKRGWCVATVYDEINTLRFCMGKQGGCEKAMSDISVADNVWYHLAVTWDGKEMLLYFNGVLAGKKKYEGGYIPAGKEDYLRIGYAGGETGSVILDIDEVAIYSRALDGNELRKLAQGRISLENRLFSSADESLRRGDYRQARNNYEKLMELPYVEDARELALFNIAESFRLEKDYASAHRTYGEILSLADLGINYRLYGLFRQAEVYLEQKNYNGARKLYSEITGTKQVSANHLFRAQMLTGDTYRFERKYGQARTIYEKLLEEQYRARNPHENCRLELLDRLDILEGLKDGQAEKSIQQKRADWVNSPKYGIYVSLHGSDENEGSKERPFATIKRAQEEVRKIKAKGMPEGGIAVYLRGGKYFITEGISFGQEDSGSADAPVVYRSYPGEYVRLIGGRQITNFKPLADPDILRRLPEESGGKVWVSDLKEAGITDFGHIRNRGTHHHLDQPGAIELFFDTKPMQLSRWPDACLNRMPNEGWAWTGLVNPEGDGKASYYTYNLGRFRYSEDRPERWKEEKDIWASGYFISTYVKNHLRVIDIDTENRTAYLDKDIRWHPSEGLYNTRVRPGMPYYFYNILGEISLPGEFYVDREKGRLYFYPPGEIEGSEVIVSTLDAPVITSEGTSNLAFFGLTLECTWHSAVTLKECRNILVAGCTIRNTGNQAVLVDGGMNNGVSGCDIYDTGDGGIDIRGGDRNKLMPSGNYAENNHIYRFNRFSFSSRYAVNLHGTGNRASHNLIHDAPYLSVYFRGWDNVIEYNEIYDVTCEGKDGGAIYTQDGPYMAGRGNMIRYNFIHHVTEHSSEVPYDNPGINGIYLDGLTGGVTMTGNVIYRCTGTALYTHGPDCRVENNIFFDNRLGIHQGDRTAILIQPLRIKQWEDGIIYGGIRYNLPPWATRYPRLPLFKSEKWEKPVGWPRDVFIEKNINAGGRFLFIQSKKIEEDIAVKDNMDGFNPMLVNPEKLDFRLRPGSPVYRKPAFDPVPFGQIGLYEDPLRASWPVVKTPAGRYYKPEKLAVLPPESRSRKQPLSETKVKPVEYEVAKKTSPINIDGRLEKEEWMGLDRKKALVIEHLVGSEGFNDRSYAWLLHDGEYLYLGIENGPNPFCPGMDEKYRKLSKVMNELAIEGVHSESTWWWQENIDTGPVYIFGGYSDGRLDVLNNFGMPRKILDYLGKAVEYKAVMLNAEEYRWTAEWKIPFAALNIRSGVPGALKFNIGGPRRGGWTAWANTGWQVDRAGILRFIR
ncbi:MAG TPA: right-handed parallel beta-helix repeat-containing protein [bacterium]|nr:right-handed parallel beta-helix repeat-containing protein [bacterium]